MQVSTRAGWVVDQEISTCMRTSFKHDTFYDHTEIFSISQIDKMNTGEYPYCFWGNSLRLVMLQREIPTYVRQNVTSILVQCFDFGNLCQFDSTDIKPFLRENAYVPILHSTFIKRFLESVTTVGNVTQTFLFLQLRKTNFEKLGQNVRSIYIGNKILRVNCSK